MPRIKLFIGVEVYGLIVTDVHVFTEEEAAHKWFKDYTGKPYTEKSLESLHEDYEQTKIFEVNLDLGQAGSWPLAAQAGKNVGATTGPNGEHIWTEKEALDSIGENPRTPGRPKRGKEPPGDK